MTSPAMPAALTILLTLHLASGGYVAPESAPTAQPRVISLAPSLTELVIDLGLGARLVGRSSACDRPADALRIPVVGDFGRPNWEAVHSTRPDVLIATDLEEPGALARFEDAGITCLLLPCESWRELNDAAHAIGRAMGDPASGEAWVARMNGRRLALRRRVDAFFAGRTRPAVYVEVWNSPLTTVGRSSFLGDVVQLAGGENIGSELDERYPHVSSEWVVGRNPDVIVLTYMLPARGIAASVGRRPGWSGIRAVKLEAICSEIPPELMLRPGPKLIEGAERLADYLMNHVRQTDPP